MAKHGTVVIKHFSPYHGDIVKLPRATTTVIFKGDFLSLESNAAVLMDAATEDATFCGIANSQHETGDAFPVTSLLRCQIKVSVTSATYGFGVELKYSAGSATVEYSLVAAGGANTIAWSAAEETVAVTQLLVDIDVRALQKLFAVSA